MELVKQLPIVEREKLHHFLTSGAGAPSDLEEYLTEQRFADGRVCPICGGAHVQRNCHRKTGAQKFICKDCGKTFSITKNTVFSGTRKSLEVWKKYMDCMAEGLTLDKSAKALQKGSTLVGQGCGRFVRGDLPLGVFATTSAVTAENSVLNKTIAN